MDYQFFGMLVAGVFAWIGLLMVIGLLALLSNRVSHMVLESYGGWKLFAEYLQWHRLHTMRGDVPPTPKEKDL